MDLGRLGREFTKGIFRENALLRLLIGLCPALAVSTRMENGIYLGVAATFVVLFSNVIVSIIRRHIIRQIRIPIFIVIIASFVTIVDLTMQAFAPAMYKELGIWIPLIVVNCMILGRVEVFGSREPPVYAAVDALGTGTGFTLVLTAMGFVREFFGTGKVIAFERTLLTMPDVYDPARILIMFPGAFLTFAAFIIVLNWFTREER